MRRALAVLQIHPGRSRATGATSEPLREKLDAVPHLARRFLAMGVLASGLSACGGAPHGPTVAVVTVCQAALDGSNPSPAESTFISTKTVKDAESSGGKAFASDVRRWIATTDGRERIVAAGVVTRECDRIGGFPRS